MRPVSRQNISNHNRSVQPAALAALWAGDGVERAGLFVLLCLFWGFVLYLALQVL
jgi:hypothetical protein